MITAQHGATSKPQNPATGKYRSVFDVQLEQQGTYRIANVNAGVSARWDTPESLAAAKAAKDAPAPAAGGMGGAARGGMLRNATWRPRSRRTPSTCR